MFRIAVCDDEAAIIGQIKNDILKITEINCRIDTYTSGEQLIKEHKNYDLIFLDIDLKTTNGIDTAKQLRVYDKKVKIVYITGYRDFAAQAFSVHAFSYMVKPVAFESLKKIVLEAYEYYLEEAAPIQVEFDTLEGQVIIEARDIYYFEYENRKVKICTKSGNFYMKVKITELLAKMQAYDFEMPHKSYIVNLYHIRSVINNNIYMTNGDLVLLSQKKASAFKQILCAYIEKQMG